jgi:hypothetical protein
MTPPKRPRRARWLVLPALVILLPLAGELWARYRVGYGNPRRIVGSETIGYRLEPGQTIDGTRGVVERINAHGYRDREWPPQPPPGLRVVVLGDTAAYAPGVAVEASWPRLLERELRERGHQATAFRLAVPGYAVAQMVGAWEADGRALEPRIVVVELSPTSVRPMRVLHEPERYPLEGVLRSSSLWDWIRRAWLVRPAGEGWPAERRVLADPYDPANDALWTEARAQLERMRVELEQRGARLVLLAAPSLAAALDPAEEDERWPAWAEERGVAFVSPAGELRAAMRPLLEEIDARGLDPAQVWNRDTDVEHLQPEHLAAACFLPRDPVHVDERGHRAVLQALLPVVEGLLPTSSEGR